MDPERPSRLRHVRRKTWLTLDEIREYDAEISESAKSVWIRYSLLEQFDARRHEFKEIVENIKKFDEEMKRTFQSMFVRHVECTLARNMYDCDLLSAYLATSKAIRDVLVLDWSNTQQQQTLEDKKRVYYFSLEFLMGRAMDNSLVNKGVKAPVMEGLNELGFHLEDILEEEPDAGLGNGGLGRLAACFIDSLSSRNYSGWGYGINYKYGIFKQALVNGYQVESPDDWLKDDSPWEIERGEIQIPVDLYGAVEDTIDDNGRHVKLWQGSEKVLAVPYDYPIPGYMTQTCNNLRLWSARPTQDFDFNKFNSGDYPKAVDSLQRAEAITSVLYPNDNFDEGKELRLKQEYFWVAASLHDILRRFRKNKHPWSALPDHVAIQLNDTHPAIAIVELMRLLVDVNKVDWTLSWSITRGVFSYTNHTVMQEALEKWPVSLFERMLPRHLEIIYAINFNFLEEIKENFPGDLNLARDCSIIEESPVKSVRMAYLAVIGSHKVNGVAELHTQLVKNYLFPHFVKVFGPEKFINITNGITPRRWLKAANPKLAELIARHLQDPKDRFLTNLDDLKRLGHFVNDTEFLMEWDAVKIFNKKRVVDLVRKTTGVELSPNMLFDVHVKRIHEYKRQQLNILAVVYRYLQIKKLKKEGLSTFEITRDYYTPTASIFGGIAAPGYHMAKTIIHLTNSVADVINADNEVADLLKVVYIPGYNVSKAEILVAGSDVSNHISTAGTEASGTSNMKFALNGGLILGTVDGANIELAREVGEENIFTFGVLADQVPAIRAQNHLGVTLPLSLLEVFNAIDSGMFGHSEEFRPLLDSIRFHGDYYLVAADFDAFLKAHKTVADEFGTGHDDEQHLEWVKKCVHSVSRMGFFSSDRAVDEYASNIWGVSPADE